MATAEVRHLPVCSSKTIASTRPASSRPLELVGFINLCGVKMRLFAIILLAGQLFGSTPQDRVAELLQQAAHETMIGPHWARLMIEADGEAEKMEQPSTFGGMYRSVRIADHPLTFLSNAISGVEDY